MGCPDRKIVDGRRCHSWCQKYKDEAAENDERLRQAHLGNLNRQYAGNLVAVKKDKAAKYKKRRGH